MGPTQSQIGKWLAAAREKAELSQSAAGRAIEKDGQQLSKWERGEREMSAVSFLALVQLYGGREAIKRLSLSLGVSPSLLGFAGDVNQESSPDVPRDVAYRPLPAQAIRKVAEAAPSHDKKRRAR